MKRKLTLKIFIFLFIFSTLYVTKGMIFTSLIVNTTASAADTVKKGDVGGYVWELQGRLKFLGFYGGTVDGKFGSRTYWAVRNFQYEFGLPIDGVVGAKTKNKLWKATQKWNANKDQKPTTSHKNNSATTTSTSAHGFSENDIQLMANAVFGESRGEPYIGQVAVAAVILNRVKSPSFPSSPSGVIFQPGAFTAVADGQIWLEPNQTAKKAVKDAINGWDPTGGAIYYFNPDTATSAWIWSRPQILKIGDHIFCK